MFVIEFFNSVIAGTCFLQKCKYKTTRPKLVKGIKFPFISRISICILLKLSKQTFGYCKLETDRLS